MNDRIIKAPEKISIPNGHKSIFLAGSIEMGKAIDWQTRLTKKLLAKYHNLVILNPRRSDWDSSWEQKVENRQFFNQVDWEHNGLEIADFVIIYFQPETQSPISLLEFGMFKNKRNVFVCCPEGFWRKGNVDYVWQKYGIRQLAEPDDIVDELNQFIGIKKVKETYNLNGNDL